MIIQRYGCFVLAAWINRTHPHEVTDVDPTAGFVTLVQHLWITPGLTHEIFRIITHYHGHNEPHVEESSLNWEDALENIEYNLEGEEEWSRVQVTALPEWVHMQAITPYG